MINCEPEGTILTLLMNRVKKTTMLLWKVAKAMSFEDACSAVDKIAPIGLPIVSDGMIDASTTN